MEKVMYPLWPLAGESADALRDTLLAELPAALAALDTVHGARLTVADSAVAPAAKRIMASHAPLPVAVLSLWVDDAGGAAAWAPLLASRTASGRGYLVAEAEPLANRRAHPAAPGERVYGMCHVVFLRKPAGLEHADWLAIWKDSHTSVAIETQSTFGYRQNLVVRELGGDSMPFDAIVEENFPPAAMESDHAFYDTGGDEALLQQRATVMLESCARFIDFEHIDVIPMSEYLIQPVALR
jgi:hypothetical protein